MKSEKIIEYAEIAAVYFRALVDKGVSATHAAQLASSFIGNVVITDAMGKEPREPWQEPGS